ncbi:MAG TPA: PepSY-associated TM helix domain-containing protein [Saprospiraceae bacterium]|nr:PepSY-associated TM helix domain-containing protein [Saprospiraceae bacterium]
MTTHPTKRQEQAKILRLFRKIHRWLGASLFLVFLLIAITGLLLGWKKNSGGFLLAPTQKGSSTDLKDWLPMDSLYQLACQGLKERTSPQVSLELDRIDVRKDKGIAKFVFSDGYLGIQIDGATGKILMLEKRNADLIENIHDGSIVDKFLGWKSGLFKLIFTSLAGLALLGFTITGFWLWYGPKLMKK